MLGFYDRRDPHYRTVFLQSKAVRSIGNIVIVLESCGERHGSCCFDSSARMPVCGVPG
jgi:hypothetical protein